MAIDRLRLHPALRSYPDSWLEPRMSWYSFFYPAEERISQMGDIQPGLLCRDVDYQNVLDQVPCPTGPDANGRGRYCALAGADLDAYREKVREWLACFDESGRQIKPWNAGAAAPVTVEQKIVAGPTPPKRAPWFGQKLAIYLRRGRPD